MPKVYTPGDLRSTYKYGDHPARTRAPQPPTPVFTLSFFYKKEDVAAKMEGGDWAKIVASFKNPPPVSAQKEGALFSPTTFTSNRRSKENATELCMAVLDFDGGLPIREAEEKARELNVDYMIYTTHSHQRATERHRTPVDCFRVVIPLAEPIPAAEFPYLWLWLNARFSLLADLACKDVSRMFYLPLVAARDAPYAFSYRSDTRKLDWREPVRRMREIEEEQVSLDAARKAIEAEKKPNAGSKSDGALRPGDDFNLRGDLRALLSKHGWVKERDDAVGERWRRPGKNRGHGAHLFHDSGLFYVFTSGGGPFDAGKVYNKFAAYALLEHSGDFEAAARALAAEGYGDQTAKKKKARSGKGAPQMNDGQAQSSNVTVGAIADLPLFDGAVALTFKKGARGKVNIQAVDKDGPIHQDAVTLTSADQRVRFLKKVAKKLLRDDGDIEEAEAALLKKAPEIEKAFEEDRKNQAKNFDPAAVYNPYEVRDGKLIWLKPISGSGEFDGLCQPITLTNFDAKITGDVIRDDGTEPVQVLEVEMSVIGNAGPHRGTVKASEFAAMRWPVAIAGAKAVIYAGKVEHVRAAVQLLSDNIKIRHVVAHTGWRKDAEGWRFYHAAGAVGAEGLIQADVELPPALNPCSLPKPPTGARLREVIRAVLFDLRKVAPDKIILPLIGCDFVAVLTGGDFSYFLLGTTGKGKTELLILAQSFFGAGFDEKHIPANWGSTAYSIQGVTHLAKDIICGVDDFVPKGTQIEQAKLHAKAETVLRGQANSSGRARCNPDGSVRPERPPRGLIVATGEDIPRGQSLVARLLAAQVEEGDVEWDQLTRCQEQRRGGVYAEATSAFLQWLATNNRIEDLRKKASETIHALRVGWAKTGMSAHKKVANTLAQVERAWDVWIEFAGECGAINEEEAQAARADVAEALFVAGQAQAKFLADENPATRFIELLKAALASGKAHLAGTEGGEPDKPAVCGWRPVEASTLSGPRTEWRGMGDRIGWVEDDNVYLQPDAAYKTAQSMGANGEGLTISSKTLWKRLKEEGMLASVDEKSQTNKVRRTINNQAERVIHVPAKFFFPANDPG